MADDSDTQALLNYNEFTKVQRALEETDETTSEVCSEASTLLEPTTVIAENSTPTKKQKSSSLEKSVGSPQQLHHFRVTSRTFYSIEIIRSSDGKLQHTHKQKIESKHGEFKEWPGKSEIPELGKDYKIV